MAEQVGYAIQSLRVETLEREIKEVKKEMKDHTKENIQDFADVNDSQRGIST